jgi:signal transduction histidine kinase
MGTETISDRAVRALLIDDDREDYLLTRDLFGDIPGGRFKLDHAPTYEAGLAAVTRGTHDVYLLDYRLGVRTGMELLREVQARGGTGGPIIILTGKGQQQIALEALRLGASDYLEKAGLSAPLLERSILYAIRQRSYEAELEREVRERTESLAGALEALRQADRRKDEFLATLAHELRNPLAPIRNALEIMRLAAGNAEAVERARAMMDRQVAQMVRLIDDLLDVSRITTGKLRLTPEVILLETVITTAVEISGPVLERAGLKFQLNLPPKSVKLHADRVRLAQVFSNLLNNAAKYTEAGGSVSLSAELDGQAVVVHVKDTGVGIPPELVPQVFELFTQVDRTLNRSQGGLGIGLALVRRLVELHGGGVSVSSDGIGKGTEFTVRLPVAGGPKAIPVPRPGAG